MRRYAEDVKHRPKQLPLGYVSWVMPVFTYPEDELIEVAGLDAAVFIRILRFGAQATQQQPMAATKCAVRVHRLQAHAVAVHLVLRCAAVHQPDGGSAFLWKMRGLVWMLTTDSCRTTASQSL